MCLTLSDASVLYVQAWPLHECCTTHRETSPPLHLPFDLVRPRAYVPRSDLCMKHNSVRATFFRIGLKTKASRACSKAGMGLWVQVCMSVKLMPEACQSLHGGTTAPAGSTSKCHAFTAPCGCRHIMKSRRTQSDADHSALTVLVFEPLTNALYDIAGWHALAPACRSKLGSAHANRGDYKSLDSKC